METRGFTRWFAAALLMTGAGAAGPAFAQTADQVAVVINELDPVSVRVGEAYVTRRGIPPENVIRLRPPDGEVIDRLAYTRTIEEPIAQALTRERLQDRVIYLVLMKGVPLGIAGTAGPEGTSASVDSELTLLYRRMLDGASLTRGRLANPYYLGDRDVATARPFRRRDHDIYLVSRIDAFNEADAMALIDRGLGAATDGRFVLDKRASAASRLGDAWLALAAERLTALGQGDRVVLDDSPNAATVDGPVLGHVSWDSAEPPVSPRITGLAFAAGALAASFASGDARTMREPPTNWAPRGGSQALSRFAGSAQPLIGDRIREGVTGVAGQVGEPYMQSVIRPQILFPAYLSGRNLVESFYLAMPHLSWQTVVVGDPLCAPFRAVAEMADAAPAMNPATDLPEYFSSRQAARIATVAPGLGADALTAWVRALGSRARGETEATRRAFEQAFASAPTSVALQLELALACEAMDDVDAAIDHYRQIVVRQPRQPIALNNLAYLLSEKKGRPQEALPFASRALALAPTDPRVLDTMAWIEHLLGDDLTSAARLTDAVRRDPTHATIRLHAAIVYAARGATTLASAALKEALRLAPALADTPAVQALQQQLAKRPG